MLRRLVSGVFIIAMVTMAASSANFAGDYTGMLGPVHVTLHLVSGQDGQLTGTADSPEQGMSGLPCSNIHIDGQALSFKVPNVNGTWTGFLSADGKSLSGTWSQGSPMPLNFTRITAGGAVSPGGPGEVNWDDYTFKFDPSGTMAQVFQGGKMVGTILTVNGQQRVVAMPGTDAAKLQKSFSDYKAFSARTHTGTAPETAAPATAVSATAVSQAPVPAIAPAAPALPQPGTALGLQNNGKADPTGIRFDDANHTITVPRTDGMTVTFVGQDVRIDDARGPEFVLRHQKGGTGRFLERTFDHRNDIGGSLSGGGIEFLHASGGNIYDSGMGTYGGTVQEDSRVRTAKQLSIIAVDAADAVRTIPGHEKFTPPGYNTLKEISQYRLRSDGSR